MYLLPFIIAFQVSTYTIDPDDQSYVSSRISTITSSDDESKNTRIRYYTQSINHILKNPLLGGGVGNWKILSIKYDAENIQNYIVPYNAHNDILEATAETGIIGGAFFVAFFFFLFYEIIKIYKKENKEAYDIQSKIILTIPFIIYMIDLNLNFPSHRPTNLYLLLIYIFIVLLINESIKGEKNNFLKTLVIVITCIISVFAALSNYRNFSLNIGQHKLLNAVLYSTYEFDDNYYERISSGYPNLTATAIPIKSIMGAYWIQKDSIDKGLDFLRKGNRENPYWIF